MIDIKLLQKDFDYVVKALQKKGVDNELLNNLKELSINTKQKRQTMEDVTAEQNLLLNSSKHYFVFTLQEICVVLSCVHIFTRCLYLDRFYPIILIFMFYLL